MQLKRYCYKMVQKWIGSSHQWKPDWVDCQEQIEVVLWAAHQKCRKNASLTITLKRFVNCSKL